jgi:predicted O-methyltransferase YrrM
MLRKKIKNMMKLSEINVVPEVFETELLDNIPKDIIKWSEMHPIERQFVNGLIRKLRPKRVLEIGVAEGAGSVVILNAIADDPEASLVSVDALKTVWNDPSRMVGFAGNEMYPDGNSQWRLFTGVDFSEIAETLGDEKFDFCVIDTTHIHPVESLNFLTVLPFLTENATVVFHDLALFTDTANKFSNFPSIPFANKLCFDTVNGEKLKPIDEAYLKSERCNGFANIGAVQICADTRKYIGNMFDMLYFPWGIYPGICIKPMAKLIKKYYPTEQFEIFYNAVRVSAAAFLYGSYDVTERPENFLCNEKPSIFYGAGEACQPLLELWKENNAVLPTVIWDKNADNITDIMGIPVVKPEFEKLSVAYKDTQFVITIAKKDIADEVREKFLKHNPKAAIFNKNCFFIEELASVLKAIREE